MHVEHVGKLLAAGFLTFAAFALTPGCDRKEKIIDVETPRDGVEVERNKDTGEIDVDVDE